MRNYFILDGVDSRDFGVYISGQGTFNASGRDYNIIPVPGRNGDLVGPEKRFANGTLTYPAFIYSNFKQNIEDFRNFLLSLVGYHDLVDSYHPNQIRKVLFQGPFNADVQSKNDAGKFDIEFICKPQRFLASGNEVTTFESAGETETFSGSVVTFDNPGGATVSALATAINPVQDLHGYGSPWPAGGGKNLFVGKALTQTINTMAFELTADDALTVNGTNTASGTIYFNIYENSDGKRHPVFPAGTYTFSSKTAIPNGMQIVFGIRDTSGNTISGVSNAVLTGSLQSVSKTIGQEFTFFCNVNCTGGMTANYSGGIQVESGTAVTAWTPYSNICPISGFSAANIVVSPTTTAGDGTTYTVSFGAAGTVYGGTLDVVNGTLTVTHKTVTYTGASNEAWSADTSGGTHCAYITIADAKWEASKRTSVQANIGKYVSSDNPVGGIFIFGSNGARFYYVPPQEITTSAEFKTWLASNNLQVVYELATAQTYTLTPTEVNLLLGTNNIWSDTGDVTATIAFPQDQFTITNPTLFDSQPFLRVYGTGTLGIGSQSVTITQADEYTDIDCEMMDCYKGTTNKNPYVQFTDYNFPVLKPGVNYVSLSGITKVEITPRWWIV